MIKPPRTVAIGCSSVAFLIAVGCIVLILSVLPNFGTWALESQLKFGLVLAFGAMFGWQAVSAFVRKAELVINEQGVFITENGQKRSYLWPDIETVRSVTTNSRGGVVLQIVRKGQITRDKTTGVVAGFAIGDEELSELIRAGVQRWGAEAPAAISGD